MSGSADPISTARPISSGNHPELKHFMDQISQETNRKPGEIILNSLLDSSDTSGTSGSWFKYDHSYLTRTCFVTCLLTLLISSIILIILIKRYTRDTLILYYSVLVYAVCQVLLFLVIVLDMALSAQSLTSLLYCKIRSSSEVFVLILSAYSILGMTAVRFIFIHRPLHYRRILKLRHQRVAVFHKVVFSALIAASPLLGLCGLQVDGEKFCHYRVVGQMCAVFHSLCSGVGIFLPVVVTAILYAIIYKSVCRLKASQARFQPVSRIPEQEVSTCSNETAKTCVSEEGKNEDEDDKNDDEKRRQTDEKLRKTDENLRKADGIPRPTVRESWAILSPNLTFLQTAGTRRAQRKLQSKGSIKESKLVPWSIMITLVLYLITTVPWIVLMTAPQLWYLKVTGQRRLVLDVNYSVMFCGIASSPVAIIVTTKALRKAFSRLIKELGNKIKRAEKSCIKL